MEKPAEDRDRITTAIRAVEARTSGEIVCVLAEQSADSGALPILLAALADLVAPWLLVAFTMLPVLAILSWQIVVFLASALLLCLPRVRVALLPRRARRATAFRVATEQFFTRSVSRKQDRSGILIFVSLAEHYARIIADDGIDARAIRASTAPCQCDWGTRAGRPRRRRFHRGNRDVRSRARRAFPEERWQTERAA